VRELPDFTCLPGKDEVGPQHRGTIHIGCTLDYLERAYDDAKYGQPSQRPIVEMTIPTSVDKTIAPPGCHILSLFVQYAPYKLSSGSWDDIKEEFADRCVAEIARYAPNVPGSILHRQVLSPLDLERIYGLTGGNIFQGALQRLPHANRGALSLRKRGPSRWRRDRGLRTERRSGNAPRRTVAAYQPAPLVLVFTRHKYMSAHK